MDFQEEINALGRRCQMFSGKLETEEATKNTLVMPFIKLLGYDPFDPTEVVPEYSAPIGDYKDARVDYALIRDGKPVIIIECKSFGTVLDAGKCNQLKLYFHGTEAKVAILTDGNHYLFFSDLEEANKMDSKPYMEFVLERPDTALSPELKKLTKDNFSVEDAMSSAVILKYTREFKRIMGEQLKQPDEEFVRFFLHQCYDGKITAAVKERFTGILKDALDLFIRDKINERFQSAIVESKPAVEVPQENTTTQVSITNPDSNDEDQSDIVTTDMEKEAYYVVKSILRDTFDVERIQLKDYKGMCTIYIDAVRQVIIRLYFNNSNLKVGFLKIDAADPKKKEYDIVPISKIDDLYNYADRIKEIAQFLASTKE